MGAASGLARGALLLLAAGLTPVHAQVELLDWLDRDGDGRVEPYEGAEALLLLAEVADTGSKLPYCSPERRIFS